MNTRPLGKKSAIILYNSTNGGTHTDIGEMPGLKLGIMSLKCHLNVQEKLNIGSISEPI